MGNLSNKSDELNLIKKKTSELDSKSKFKNSKLTKVKFEIYGEEMINKVVKSSGNSGRIYLPPDWVGSHVKVVRID